MLNGILAARPGFHLFGTDFIIYWYAVFMVIAIMTAGALSYILLKRRNMSTEIFLIGFIICVPCAIVGARVFYCITDGYIQRGASLAEWLDTRSGGMSILGAIIGGVLSGLVFAIVKKLDFFRLADCVLPTLPIAQAIGRWGNFVNQEVYGKVVTNSSLQFFPFAVYIDSCKEWHYALFFYEGVINTLIFCVLFYFAWNHAKKPNGILGAAMITLYGIVRSIMEPLRDSKFILSGNGSDVMFSRLTSIMMIIGGLTVIVVLLVVNKKREGKFFGSANGDPYGIGKFIKCDKTDEPVYDRWNLATKLYHKDIPVEEKVETGKGTLEENHGDVAEKKDNGEA